MMKSKATVAVVEPVQPVDMATVQREIQRCAEAVRDAVDAALVGQVVGGVTITAPTGRVVVNVEASTRASSPASTVLGHFAPRRWMEGGDRLHQIAVSPYHINRPVAEVVGTMVHEYLHLTAEVNGIKDTSRQGTFHNATFAALVKLTPLLDEGSRDKRIGVTTTPSDALRTWCAEELHPNFGAAVKLQEDKPNPKPPTTVRFECYRCETKATVSAKQVAEGFVPLCAFAHAAKAMTPVS